MWKVDNRTPFAAEHGWVRDRNGAEGWLGSREAPYRSIEGAPASEQRTPSR